MYLTTLVAGALLLAATFPSSIAEPIGCSREGKQGKTLNKKEVDSLIKYDNHPPPSFGPRSWMLYSINDKNERLPFMSSARNVSHSCMNSQRILLNSLDEPKMRTRFLPSLALLDPSKLGVPMKVNGARQPFLALENEEKIIKIDRPKLSEAFRYRQISDSPSFGFLSTVDSEIEPDKRPDQHKHSSHIYRPSQNFEKHDRNNDLLKAKLIKPSGDEVQRNKANEAGKLRNNANSNPDLFLKLYSINKSLSTPMGIINPLAVVNKTQSRYVAKEANKAKKILKPEKDTIHSYSKMEQYRLIASQIVSSIFHIKSTQTINNVLTYLFIGLNIVIASLLLTIIIGYFVRKHRKRKEEPKFQPEAKQPETEALLGSQTIPKEMEVKQSQSDESSQQYELRVIFETDSKEQTQSSLQGCPQKESDLKVVPPAIEHTNIERLTEKATVIKPDAARLSNQNVWSPMSLLEMNANDAYAVKQSHSNKRISLQPTSKDSNDTFKTLLDLYTDGSQSQSALSYFIDKQTDNFKAFEKYYNADYKQEPIYCPPPTPIEPYYSPTTFKISESYLANFSDLRRMMSGDQKTDFPINYGNENADLSDIGGPKYYLRYKLSETAQTLRSIIERKQQGFRHNPDYALENKRAESSQLSEFASLKNQCLPFETLYPPIWESDSISPKKLPNFIQKSISSPQTNVSVTQETRKPFFEKGLDFATLSLKPGPKYESPPVQPLPAPSMSQDVFISQSFEQLQNVIMKELASIEDDDLTKEFMSKWDSIERLMRETDPADAETAMHSFMNMVKPLKHELTAPGNSADSSDFRVVANLVDDNSEDAKDQKNETAVKEEAKKNLINLNHELTDDRHKLATDWSPERFGGAFRTSSPLSKKTPSRLCNSGQSFLMQSFGNS